MAYAPPWVSPGQTPLENVGQELVSAAATGVQLNLKKQEVQGKLAALALRNQQLEANRDIMEQRFEETQRQNAFRNEMAMRGFGLREDAYNLRDMVAHHNMDLKDEQIQQIS